MARQVKDSAIFRLLPIFAALALVGCGDKKLEAYRRLNIYPRPSAPLRVYYQGKLVTVC